MIWDHKVVQKMHQHPDGVSECEYAIHEVFFDEDDKSAISWTKDPVPVVGESLESLRQTLVGMLDAVDKAIANPDDILIPE